ncbi:MAG TPA: hypothetical protein VH561_13905 [Micromonosporaceae bacterium]|jgi:hypothetical protein
MPLRSKERNVVERRTNKPKQHHTVPTGDDSEYMCQGTDDVALICIWPGTRPA